MTWTPERHQAAKQRCENATPEPWDLIPVREEDGAFSLLATDDDIGFIHIARTTRPVDGWFISQSRTDLPDALEEIERLYRSLALATELIGELRSQRSLSDVERELLLQWDVDCARSDQEANS